MAPSGEFGTARRTYLTQSTWMRPDRSRRADSSHATGTEMRALTAHSCTASVESSRRATSVSARGSRVAADCRVYRPSASLPVITPTSTGGGTPPSSRGGRARRWGRPLPVDSRDGVKEPSPGAASLSACRWSCHAHRLSLSLGNHRSRGSNCGPGISTPSNGVVPHLRLCSGDTSASSACRRVA
eukprot:2670841-Rhodomonas_salina.2